MDETEFMPLSEFVELFDSPEIMALHLIAFRGNEALDLFDDDDDVWLSREAVNVFLESRGIVTKPASDEMVDAT